ncbi:hypothetical protein JVT61DRAFT_12825 [Boletus reticuloceps]|uniref:Uncharacterized protein n=1 Tax=Boletus reticuloceps TaxID=495285 RepID=A0A8I3ADK6_9AGAM|nr:hypothetical protein JVT61DRAFT_12825 [Boletus reticuloceps]
MLPSSVKRILTDDERATRLASESQTSDATSAADLAASIRAASMRARKTVTEGYLSSPPSSPLKQAPVSLTYAVSYPITARENNRQVFSSLSGTYSPLPSPSKRKRPYPDSHDDDEKSITPPLITPQSQDRGHLAAELSGDDMEVDRPMKPLRRSGRIGEVSPLPPTRSLFSCETEMNSHQCEAESTDMCSTQPFSPEAATDNEQQ